MDEVATGTASGAISGAAMGAMVGGPVGAAIGGVAGGAIGFMSGSAQKKARKAQERALREQQEAQRREQARREAAVQATRAQFGDIWSLWHGAENDAKLLSNDFQLGNVGILGGFIGQDQLRRRQAALDEAKRQAAQRQQMRQAALRNYALWAGNIQRQAQQAGEGFLSEGLANIQQQSRATREAMLRRGLLGSSLDQSAKLALNQQLGNVVGGAQVMASQQYQQAIQNLRDRQRQFEAMARQGTDISGLSQAMAQQHQLAAQRAMIPATMFGNMLNTGMQFATYYALTNAQRPTGNTGGGVS